MKRLWAVLSAVLLLAASACGDTSGRAAPTAALRAASVTPPPEHVRFDYQLGGNVTPDAGVGIVARDRLAAPAPGIYNICYVNAFQTQDSEARFWRNTASRWRLVLKNSAGRAVVDSGWGEWVLDTRTSASRHGLALIVDRWLDGCAAKGYDAVELDNLDSFSRSQGLISRAADRAFAAHLIGHAHARDLAVGQKNWPELGAAGPKLGFDFAVAEECGQYQECGAYVATYGAKVLAIEYTAAGFAWTCEHDGTRVSVVRRDLALSRDGVREWC